MGNYVTLRRLKKHRDLAEAQREIRRLKKITAIAGAITIVSFGSIGVVRVAVDNPSIFPHLAGIVGLLSFAVTVLTIPYVWRFNSIARDIETAIRGGKLQ